MKGHEFFVRYLLLNHSEGRYEETLYKDFQKIRKKSCRIFGHHQKDD